MKNGLEKKLKRSSVMTWNKVDNILEFLCKFITGWVGADQIQREKLHCYDTTDSETPLRRPILL